jgi:hypothetical protein
MKNLFWKIIAFIVSRPIIVDWLIDQAMKTPYSHIQSRYLEGIYMFRYWLLNAYTKISKNKTIQKLRSRLSSVRLHKIMLPDSDSHLHDHPWNARTIILRGMYIEERMMPDGTIQQFTRRAGDTATLKFGEYHRIVLIPKEGVWTMFISQKYQGTWGFLVDGIKVPHREYNK